MNLVGVADVLVLGSPIEAVVVLSEPEISLDPTIRVLVAFDEVVT